MYKIKALHWFGLVEHTAKTRKEALEIWQDRIIDSCSVISASISYNGKKLDSYSFTEQCVPNRRMS